MSTKLLLAKELGLLIEAKRDWPETTGKEWAQKHTLLAGPRVCEHVVNELKLWAPPLDNGLPRVHVFSSTDSPMEVLKHTRWVVFMGAGLSSEFLYMTMQNCLIFAFIPHHKDMETLVEQIDTRVLARKNIYFFCGDVDAMDLPLRELLPIAATAFGPPAFYYAENSCSWGYATHIWDTVELVYYHATLYPEEGRRHDDDPRRVVAGGFTFAQQKHLIENLKALPSASSVEALHNQHQGNPALLVAASADLVEQLPEIARLREHCVLICANKSCRVLLQHGIVPDFVVLLDSSEASAQELCALPPLPETAIVSHILCGAQRGNFRHTYFFGGEMEQLGLPICMVDHSGSIINYQFHLANFLGCTRIFVAGVALCAKKQHGGSYAEGTAPKKESDIRWTYPVASPYDPETIFYTSLNFADVANWLQAYIQKNNLNVTNLTRDSLLSGTGITFDAHPQFTGPAIQRPLQWPRIAVGEDSLQKIEKALQTFSETWDIIFKECDRVLKVSDTEKFSQFMAVLKAFDAKGMSMLLESFPSFQNFSRQFHITILQGTEQEQTQMALLYLQCMYDVASQLRVLLKI